MERAITHTPGAGRPTCAALDRERVQVLANEMLARERWPRARLLEYQRRRLQEIVQHAEIERSGAGAKQKLVQR